MRKARWRCAAMLPVALAVTHCAEATDLPVQPAEGAPVVKVERGDPPAEPSEASWYSDLLAPLRGFGVESWWDIFLFQPWTGSIGFAFDDQKQRVKAPDSPTQVFASRLWTENITFGNDGISIIDPKLFTSSLILGLTLQQGRQQAPGIDQSQKATLVNYGFHGTFLAESPYNLDVSATRAQNTYVQPSGSTTDSDITTIGALFRLRETSILRDREILPFFSGSVGVYGQRQRQTTTLGGQTFTQDDRQDRFLLGFQNGTETSDMSFQYDYTRLTNYAYSSGSYNSQTANFTYSVDFGPTLNKRSDSLINYYTRHGADELSDLNTLEISEFLTIDHNADLSSNYIYQLIHQTTPIGNVTTQSGGVQVNEQVFRNLSLTQGVNGLYTTLPGGGSVKTGGVAGNFNYSRALPWDGQLTLSGGGGYAYTSSQVPSGIVQVVDQPYVVPQDIGAGASILLRDRNILTETIVVIVIKSGGVRVPAVLDVDYTVQVNGDRTSLFPLASSVVMQPGDPLNISYSYEVSPSSEYQSVSASASFGLDWPWFGVLYTHDQTDQSPLSGSDSTFLVSERRDTGFAYLRGVWDTLQVRLGAGIISYDTPQLAYVEQRYDQFVEYRPYANLYFALAANQSHTDYQRPSHVTTTQAVRFDANWSWGPWLTSCYASWRSYTDTEQPSETVAEAGFRVRRTWTKLDVNVYGAYQKRTKGDITSPNAIIHVGVVRRF